MSANSLQKYADEYPAMFNWCQREYSNNPAGLYFYIVEAIAAGNDDCVFFDMLIDLGGDMKTLVDLILTTKPQGEIT